MRIIAHLVTHNEEARYLRDVLWWLNTMVDEVYVWDDQSTDNTVEIARLMGAHVEVRGQDVLSFAQDEAECRAAGWWWMIEASGAAPQDWVLCLDADEFLVPGLGVTATERQMLEDATQLGGPVIFPVAEVFAVQSGIPMVRLDGYWGQIEAMRLVPARGMTFRVMTEGCGSVPAHNFDAEGPVRGGPLSILHYGYARPEDRQLKHQRYGRGRGHNPIHVASIVTPGRLVPWSGKAPSL